MVSSYLGTGTKKAISDKTEKKYNIIVILIKCSQALTFLLVLLFVLALSGLVVWSA